MYAVLWIYNSKLNTDMAKSDLNKAVDKQKKDITQDWEFSSH